jgi:hypothetical protein
MMKPSNSYKMSQIVRSGVFRGGLLLALCFVTLLFVRLYVAHPATGDEPHYLLMDYSLVHDHDLNLKNNYQNGDYRAFYPEPLAARGQIDKLQFDSGSNKFYSIHGIGIPVLILPGYLIGSQGGVMVEMTLIATAVVWLTWLWTFKLTKNNRSSVIVAGLLAICLSFNGLAGYIYPDLIIAGLTLAALLILNFYFKKPVYQFVFGLVLAVLVLIHFKTLSLAVPMFIIMVYRLWQAERKLPWWAVLSAAPLAIYFLITLHMWYGVWNPTQIYPSDATLTASPLHTIPAMLFDASRGLFVYNPILLLIVVGLAPWFRQRRQSLVIAVLATAPSILLLTTFRLWNGGYAPTGRYLMDVVPVFVPAMAFALALLRARWQQAVVVVLIAATLFISVASTALKPSYLDPEAYRTRTAFFSGVEKHTHIGFDHLLPSYSRYTTLDDRRGGFKVFLGMLALLSLAGYGYYLSRPQKAIKS